MEYKENNVPCQIIRHKAVEIFPERLALDLVLLPAALLVVRFWSVICHPGVPVQPSGLAPKGPGRGSRDHW
jgi:hypothetical protein